MLALRLGRGKLLAAGFVSLVGKADMRAFARGHLYGGLGEIVVALEPDCNPGKARGQNAEAQQDGLAAVAGQVDDVVAVDDPPAIARAVADALIGDGRAELALNGRIILPVGIAGIDDRDGPNKAGLAPFEDKARLDVAAPCRLFQEAMPAEGGKSCPQGLPVPAGLLALIGMDSLPWACGSKLSTPTGRISWPQPTRQAALLAKPWSGRRRSQRREAARSTCHLVPLVFAWAGHSVLFFCYLNWVQNGRILGRIGRSG